MKLIADLHIHSKYSRATSSDMNIPNIAKWAKYKGIKLVGTGDFTHPLWLQELKKYLKPVSDKVYEYNGINFIVTGEVNNIYHRKGSVRKVHNVIFVPGLSVAEKINVKLSRFGNLLSDGRPILSLDSEDLVKIVLDISPECMIVPAHVWTPHFSVFGSNSGFNSLEECYGSMVKNIHAIETGLSSDPAMNWRVSSLDPVSLLSNSDAHSAKKLGREVNIFDVNDSNDLYDEILEIIKTKNRKKFLSTLEFFPEEGKYHLDGHRNCNLRISPKEAISKNNQCPVCGKKVTVGVLHRVEELADREENIVSNGTQKRVPYKKIIPLEEIIAESHSLGKGTSTAEKDYFNLINRLGNEFDILLNISEEMLLKNTSIRITEGIMKMRQGEVEINPGYDGVFGEVKIHWGSVEQKLESNQLDLF